MFSNTVAFCNRQCCHFEPSVVGYGYAFFPGKGFLGKKILCLKTLLCHLVVCGKGTSSVLYEAGPHGEPPGLASQPLYVWVPFNSKANILITPSVKARASINAVTTTESNVNSKRVPDFEIIAPFLMELSEKTKASCAKF
jgi:hypothetical protein